MENAPLTQVHYARHGKPVDVIEVKNYSIPKPGSGQVGVRLVAAPINPSDIGVIEGRYGVLPGLPSVGGREGVGEIVLLGDGVDKSWLGTQVRMPRTPGTWQDISIEWLNNLHIIPGGLPNDMAAMAFINPPTAWMLLHESVFLKPGDWIIQNGGNSAVGMNVIQLAKHFGYKTLSVVRDEFWKEELKKYGADVVVLEDSKWYKDIEDLTSAPPKLALNSIGGRSALNLIKALPEGATCVTYGAMTSEQVRFPTKEFIFKDITAKGFWLDRWLRSVPPQKSETMYKKIFMLIREGVFHIPVEKKYSLADAHAALEHAQKAHRRGKILFTSDTWQKLNAKD